MIKIQVKLKNENDIKYEVITITKEELLQLACNKAKGQYVEGYYNEITTNSEIEIKTNLYKLKYQLWRF